MDRATPEPLRPGHVEGLSEYTLARGILFLGKQLEAAPIQEVDAIQVALHNMDLLRNELYQRFRAQGRNIANAPVPVSVLSPEPPKAVPDPNAPEPPDTPGYDEYGEWGDEYF